MPFTPVHTLLGGFLLHLSTSTLLQDTGRVLGISGITDGAILGDRQSWRWAIVAGLLSGPMIGRLLGMGNVFPGDALGSWQAIPAGRAVIAGLCVGIGSKLGSGCTSGHFLCGVSRGSPRSIVATATFFSVAMVTANVVPLEQLPAASAPFALVLPDVESVIICTRSLATLLVPFFALRYSLSRQTSPSTAVRLLPYFFTGSIFSIGLLLSGMADPFKVLAFLRAVPPFTHFDPSLAMVVLSGVLMNAVHWVSLEKGKVRYLWEQWRVPSRRDIDWRLICGAALFGIGWGLAGVCPGPAIVGLGTAARDILLGEPTSAAAPLGSFAASMVAGMSLAGMI